MRLSNVAFPATTAGGLARGLHGGGTAIGETSSGANSCGGGAMMGALASTNLRGAPFVTIPIWIMSSYLTGVVCEPALGYLLDALVATSDRAYRVADGQPPLHELLWSDVEVSLLCGHCAKALGEDGEGHLVLGIQTDLRGESADGYVIEGPSQAELDGRHCTQVASVQPERREKHQGELNALLPRDVH
ncbi:hypothetical protein L1987_46712 [Smallanthus sonchifolius]|uniref:Uncharacterized protein n=1 Tax=Smallanthus sonchifolius TaxID=185202 RepID=A0ACB9G1K8_9ASTR|nr:hypothetical protein L1987_46712 [Smallanthus sonchifolius]